MESLAEAVLHAEGSERRQTREGLLEGPKHGALRHEMEPRGLDDGGPLVPPQPPEEGQDQDDGESDPRHGREDDQHGAARLEGDDGDGLQHRSQRYVHHELVLPEAVQQPAGGRRLEEGHRALDQAVEDSPVDPGGGPRAGESADHAREHHQRHAERQDGGPGAQVELQGLGEQIVLPHGEPDVGGVLADGEQPDQEHQERHERPRAEEAAVEPEGRKGHRALLLGLVRRHARGGGRARRERAHRGEGRPALHSRRGGLRGDGQPLLNSRRGGLRGVGQLLLHSRRGGLPGDPRWRGGRRGSSHLLPGRPCLPGGRPRVLHQLVQHRSLLRELREAAVLHDAAVAHDQDAVHARVIEHVHLGRGDQARGAVKHPAEEAVEDVAAHLHVERREGVVEEREPGTGVGHAREPDPRPLPAGERDALLADLGLVPPGQDLEVDVQGRGVQGVEVALLFEGAAEEHVVPHRGVHDEAPLRRVGETPGCVDGAGRVARAAGRGFLTGNGDLAQEGREERGLALAEVAHDEDQLPAGHAEAHVPEGGLAAPRPREGPAAHGDAEAWRGHGRDHLAGDEVRLGEQVRQALARGEEHLEARHGDPHEGEGDGDRAEDLDQREDVGHGRHASVEPDVEAEDREGRERGQHVAHGVRQPRDDAQLEERPLLLRAAPADQALKLLLPRLELHHLRGLEHLVARGDAPGLEGHLLPERPRLPP
mmetsp:Transcript_84836/g.262645  ORF Transcript_84836/g.262645 Transcript_84836/m.262645 type:complete len:710 (-) Transcript_84836:77-2206(-)